MRNLVEKWIDSEGYSDDRKKKLLKSIDKAIDKKVDARYWLIEEDGTIGLNWKGLLDEVLYDLRRLNIDDTAILTITNDGKKHYSLPPGMNGMQFGKWLEVNREIVEYWYDHAVRNLIETGQDEFR